MSDAVATTTHQRFPTHLSLCSGVKLGVSLSRSSIKMKSFPRPSYLANSIKSPIPANDAVRALPIVSLASLRDGANALADVKQRIWTAVPGRNALMVDLGL